MGDATEELDEINDPILENFETPYDFEIDAAEAELMAMLDKCMPKRAERQKFVLIQLVFFERSVLQVAEMLDRSAANVHVLFRRAKVNVLKHCPRIIERLLTILRPSQRTKYAGGDV